MFEKFRSARNTAQVLSGRLHGLDDGHQRRDVDLLADTQDLALQNGQGQGQADSDRAAEAFGAEYLYVTAEIVDVAPDDVHADSAARHVANLVGRRKSGDEDQIVDLLVGQNLVFLDQAAFARFREYPRLVEACAVILDLDDDAAALVEGVERQCPGLALAGGESLFGHLHAVVERIAHEVNEWIADFLQYGLIEFGILPAQLEFHFLAELARQVVDQARKPVEGESDWQHADLHHTFLQLARITGKLYEAASHRFEISGFVFLRKSSEH